MTSRKVRFFFLLLCACGLAALASCRAPLEEPADTATRWNFDADIEGWWLVDYDSNSVNPYSDLYWSTAEGSPAAGALRIVADFTKAGSWVSVVAPIVEDPLVAGTDLTGKKFTVRVKTTDNITTQAVYFGSSGNSGNS